MNLVAPYTDTAWLQSLAVWVISFFLIAAGISYAKDLISFVLMELYKLFIQENII
jgi:hypothetical protein